MNDTKIEWCDSSWNPMTGCLHKCEYCYARGIAQRFGGRWDDEKLRHIGSNGELHYLVTPQLRHTTGKNRDNPTHYTLAPYPYGFDPTFHSYRLDEPARKTKSRTIFLCSMADLFGEWVPLKWIVEVLDACRAAPQHRYLFLTKNPKRYMELAELALLPKEDNFWYGSTATTPEDEYFHSQDYHTFLSIEPIMGNFTVNPDALDGVGWVILGAETGNRKDKVVPERSWIEPIVLTCDRLGVPVFMKGSMTPIWGEKLIMEFPWA